MINPFTGGLEYDENETGESSLSLEKIDEMDINKLFNPMPSL